MRSTIIALVLLIAAAGTSRAGEKPAIHLTGNPTVDFFSDQRLAAKQLQMPPLKLDDQDATAGGGDEKSPVVAGLLSLVLPGAGELYTKNYVKAAVFGAVEITSWIFAYTYNKRGDQQTDAFEAFANQHWRASKYVNWTLNNLGVLDPDIAGQQVDWGNKIYRDGYDPQDPPVSSPPYPDMDWKEINALEDQIRTLQGNGYSHLLPPWNDQQYYELIGKYDQFSRGWDDAADDVLSPGDLPIKSNSKRFYEYAAMRAEANHQYDVAGTFVSVAVVNHLVSMIDAFWSASRYNSNLHAELRMRVQPTQYGVEPVTEAKLRYDF